jgi:hypothetical protein
MAPAAGRCAGSRHRPSLERPASRPTAIAAAACAGRRRRDLRARVRGRSFRRPSSASVSLRRSVGAGHGAGCRSWRRQPASAFLRAAPAAFPRAPSGRRSTGRGASLPSSGSWRYRPPAEGRCAGLPSSGRPLYRPHMCRSWPVQMLA